MKPPNVTNTSPAAPPAADPTLTPSPAPPAGAAPPAPPAPPPVEAAPPSPPAPAPVPVTNVPTRKLLTESDDDLPEAETYEMSSRALKKRLERATKSELKKLFGTDNIADIEKMRAEHAALTKAAEDKRLADLSEAERWKEQYEKQKREYDELTTRYQGEQMARVVDHEDRRITGLVAEHIDQRYLRTELPRLAAFLAGCSDEELKNDEKLIKDWCAKSVSETPWMAKGWVPPAAPIAADPTVTGTTTPAAAPPAAPPMPIAIPMSNGAPGVPGQNASPTGTNGQKSVKDMTETEWRIYKRQNGLHF